MITVEFHCHTTYSHDSLVSATRLHKICQKKSLDRLVITDHNTIEGALVAQALDPLTIIIGEEILTRQGELLAVFVTQAVPAGLSARETIQLLRQQQAFISVSHPLDMLRKGHWDEADLNDILPYVDAIEVFNSRCLSPQSNQQAQSFALDHHLPGIVGSDAHSVGEVGSATLTLPEFHDAASLKLALQYAQPRLRLSSPWVHIYSRYAAWRTHRGCK